MPKIKNESYKQFLDGYIELITKEQFDTWLTNISTAKLPRQCEPNQARALLIAVFITGRRPSEIADLKGIDVSKETMPGTKQTKLYTLHIKTLKGGKSHPITIPHNPYTDELYVYMKGRPEQLYSFWGFRQENSNSVKWKMSRKVYIKTIETDGTSNLTMSNEPEQKKKVYIRKGDMINHYITLWTGKPAYWFRHHRYSSMYAQGATDAEVQMFKGAKDPASLEPYKHMSKKLSESIVKRIKF
jgi:hypothetical protein